MGAIVPLKGRPRRPPREPSEPAEPDTWDILDVVPARRGWYAYVLAYDDVTSPQLVPAWWRKPVAAWGHVEWTWGGTMLPGFAKVEQFWEALTATESGVLLPATVEENITNVVTVEVCGPGDARPAWYGGPPGQRALAQELVEEYLARHPPAR